MDLFGNLAEVLIAGIILGAGLPVLFALGIRLSVPAADAEGPAAHHVSPLRRTGAYLCFAVIAVAVIVGLLWITQGRLYDTFGWDIFGTGGSSEG
ncbi:hypothetical protein [Corynebacterium nuruki]|jgi:hypothetical protein|uniref:Uncharacterized protein n=1 Tax=Corynebacterium nuruki TaxID=1032851 RepID=A0A3D4SXW5_9CORY|nr:hypothetical protein [Corynebacterium nuruki]HCT14092.1 hypothetical protein [Corynebacterium nuruki]